MLAANKTFIANAKHSNKTIWFSHDPLKQLANYPNSIFAKELRYIEDLYGVTLSELNVYKSGNIWYFSP